MSFNSNLLHKRLSTPELNFSNQNYKYYYKLNCLYSGLAKRPEPERIQCALKPILANTHEELRDRRPLWAGKDGKASNFLRQWGWGDL